MLYNVMVCLMDICELVLQSDIKIHVDGHTCTSVCMHTQFSTKINGMWLHVSRGSYGVYVAVTNLMCLLRGLCPAHFSKIAMHAIAWLSLAHHMGQLCMKPEGETVA